MKMRAHHSDKMITCIFSSSKTAKGLFDASDDEDKELSGAFAAAISGKKGSEDPSEDADKKVCAPLVREYHVGLKCIWYVHVVCVCGRMYVCLCVYRVAM